MEIDLSKLAASHPLRVAASLAPAQRAAMVAAIEKRLGAAGVSAEPPDPRGDLAVLLAELRREQSINRELRRLLADWPEW